MATNVTLITLALKYKSGRQGAGFKEPGACGLWGFRGHCLPFSWNPQPPGLVSSGWEEARSLPGKCPLCSGDTTNREQDRLPWPSLQPAVPAPCPGPRPLCRRLRTSLSPWTMTEGASRPRVGVRQWASCQDGAGIAGPCVSFLRGPAGLHGDSPWFPGAVETANSARCPGPCLHRVGYCPADHGRSRGQAQRHASEEQSPPGRTAKSYSHGEAEEQGGPVTLSAISELLQSVQVVEA